MFLALWLAAVLACRDAIQAPAGAPPPEALALPDLDVRGVVFLEVDTLRADHLPMYGYGRDTLPLTRARPWLQVTGHRAPASWTVPSVTSLLTSLEPARHGLMSKEDDLSALLVADTWPERLAAAGFATALFTGNSYVGEWTGIDQRFGTAELLPGLSGSEHNLDALVAAALAWIDGLAPDQRFFVHLQPMDVHSPLRPEASDLATFRDAPLPLAAADAYSSAMLAEAWMAAPDEAGRAAVRAAAVDLYDASVLGVDRATDTLLRALEARQLLTKTLVVFSADHGETLDDPEDGSFGHGFHWREELSRIPLMFLGPGIAAGETRCLSMNLDVWPTVAARMGLDGLADIDGIDLGGGCRDHARGSYWEPGPALSFVGVATWEAALGHDCSGAREAGTAIGEGADPTQQTPARQLPQGEELSALLDTARADILARWPEVGCGDR